MFGSLPGNGPNRDAAGDFTMSAYHRAFHNLSSMAERGLDPLTVLIDRAHEKVSSGLRAREFHRVTWPESRGLAQCFDLLTENPSLYIYTRAP